MEGVSWEVLAVAIVLGRWRRGKDSRLLGAQPGKSLDTFAAVEGGDAWLRTHISQDESA